LDFYAGFSNKLRQCGGSFYEKDLKIGEC
jgi:hypothetical protein